MMACEVTRLSLNCARLEYNSSAGCWSWVVPCCSLCGRQHVHGGGSVESDARRWLGHRVAHCPTGLGGSGYLLADVNPRRTLKFIRQIRGCSRRELAA
jgi:hypothetical protein